MRINLWYHKLEERVTNFRNHRLSIPPQKNLIEFMEIFRKKLDVVSFSMREDKEDKVEENGKNTGLESSYSKDEKGTEKLEDMITMEPAKPKDDEKSGATHL
ncbi:unnamed protein product [Caenorhabditis brenneri]